MKRTALAVMAVIGMGAFSGAQAFTIDTFNDATAQIVIAPGSDTSPTAEAVGGQRSISNTKSGPLGVTTVVAGGFFSHSADALTSGVSTVTWNAGGADLTDGGGINGRFVLDIQSIDQGSIGIDLTVDGVTASFGSPGVGLQELSFSAFSGVDFSSVSTISMIVTGGVASDLTLDMIGTVNDPAPPQPNPLPGSLLLIGAGLLGFGASRRK